MADSRMSANVSPLAQSVVDASTTDVDANAKASNSTGESNTVGAQSTKGGDATDSAKADAKHTELTIDAEKANGTVCPAEVRGERRTRDGRLMMRV